jgi:hypothetical protein
MSARELDDWYRYYRVEPWGTLRDNQHAGIIAAEIRAPRVRRGKPAPTFKDFMLRDAETARAERRAGTVKALAALKASAKRKPK